MSYRSAFGSHAGQFAPLSPKRLAREISPRCVWRERPGDAKCGLDVIDGTPVCYWHGVRIAARVFEHEKREREEIPPPDDAERWPTDEEYQAQLDVEREEELARRKALPAFVYYLMLSPTTVKIGTTRYLKQRISTHGSELQYIVALERGGYDVEKLRHDQFPMERHGIKEVFTISDALRTHIESLVPQRDQLMKLALGE
ncbi:hypothetical protein MHPYR_180075 [uncultured Mycobacterium sp.]|uniref:GIY-YIG nuclease family protein n=1 Tax=uncultured Mycobacterium sp. TaxID=171292 RepID=A0A1Y5P589_9MYCO|nr:hypothetical protein MHPYR_180075 [uncultured Mycobacterium sp.]